jgi:hypothetical protein
MISPTLSAAFPAGRRLPRIRRRSPAHRGRPLVPCWPGSNNDAAAQSEGPSAAEIPPPDFTIAFIFIGIGIVGLLMLVAWIVLRFRRG